MVGIVWKGVKAEEILRDQRLAVGTFVVRLGPRPDDIVIGDIGTGTLCICANLAANGSAAPLHLSLFLGAHYLRTARTSDMAVSSVCFVQSVARFQRVSYHCQLGAQLLRRQRLALEAAVTTGDQYRPADVVVVHVIGIGAGRTQFICLVGIRLLCLDGIAQVRIVRWGFDHDRSIGRSGRRSRAGTEGQLATELGARRPYRRLLGPRTIRIISVFGDGPTLKLQGIGRDDRRLDRWTQKQGGSCSRKEDGVWRHAR